MCNITITFAEKNSSQILIKGRSTNCLQISVQLTSPISTAPKIINVVGGFWEVSFSITEFIVNAGFNCNSPIKIEIFCVEQKTCIGPGQIQLDCKEVDCPQIDVAIKNISDCNDEGKRTVTLEVQSTSNDVLGQIQFGDGEDDVLDFVAGNPQTISHDYNSGSFNAFVEILSPRNCPDSQAVDIIIDECDINCPTDVTFEIRNLDGERYSVINGELVNISTGLPVDCLEAGAYRIEAISPIDSSFTYYWRADELPTENTGNINFFDFKIDDCIAKTILVTITKVNCPPLSESIKIEECCEVKKDCLVSDWSDWSECNNNRQRRTRTIISREQNGGKKCPPLIQEQDCKIPNPFVIALCGAAKALLIIGVSLLLVGIVLLLCPAFTFIPPPASTILATTLIIIGSGIFLLGLIMWLIFCSPGLCDFLILSWQILFLAFAAFTYAAFCPACFYLIFGVVFLVLSILLFIVWQNKCKPSICKIYFELFFLINIGLNMVSGLEYGLGWTGCLISVNPVGMHLWMAGVAILNTIVALGLSRNRCLRE